MDDDAKDRIIEDINLSRGFENELKRVFVNENDQDNVSKNQERAIRDRMTASASREGGKIERYGKTYINVKEDEYRRVTSNDDVYEDDYGNVWLRDSEGKFKKKIRG